MDEQVTILVSGTDAHLLANRTLRILQALVAGIQIVSEKWVEASLKDWKNLARPEDWEVLDEELQVEGSRLSREAKARGDPALLQGIQVLVRSEEEFKHLGG